jgi:hypothetical protein
MYTSQVIQLLKSLSKKEINDLYYFIESPFLSKVQFKSTHKTVGQKILIQFYKILRGAHPDFSKKGLHREAVFKKLFPGEIYNDRKFRNIKHELSNIIENYLSYLDYAEDPIDHKIHLINQTEKRKLDKLFELNIHTINKLLDLYDVKNEEYHFKKYLLAQKERIFNDNKTYLGKSQTKFNILKDEISFTTDCFFLIILKQLSIIHHVKYHLNLDINTDFYDYVYNYLKKHSELFHANNVLQILNKFILLYTSQASKNDINELRVLLYENEKCFSKLDFQYLCIDLLSYCIIRFLKGEYSFKDTLFELLKDCVDKEVYIQEGLMHEHNYTSIASLAIRLKELKWAEEFIKKYKIYLSSEVRENAYLYNYASYFYILKEYDRAMEMLSKVKNTDFYYTTGIYNLQLRIYYEMGSLEPALSLVDSYRHFFSKNKLIPSDYKKRYKNFLNFYEKMVKIRNCSSNIPPGMLIRELENTEEVEYRGWLTNKIKELHSEIETS